MGPRERWGYVGFGLGQRGIMGGRRASEAQGCLGEGRVGLAPLLESHPSRALSFTSVSTVPILQRETERPRAVLPGRRPWQTLKPALPSPTPPRVSNSFPPDSRFLFSVSPRVSDHMDMGPSELVGRSCYQFVHGQDAARIRQSHLDRETHFCTLSPPTSHHKDLNAPAALLPGSPSPGLTAVSACTAAPGALFGIEKHQRA